MLPFLFAVQRTMCRDMDQFQVLNPVIRLAAVQVMDVVTGRNWPVREFPHKSMLGDLHPTYTDSTVPLHINAAAPWWLAKHCIGTAVAPHPSKMLSTHLVARRLAATPINGARRRRGIHPFSGANWSKRIAVALPAPIVPTTPTAPDGMAATIRNGANLHSPIVPICDDVGQR